MHCRFVAGEGGMISIYAVPLSHTAPYVFGSNGQLHATRLAGCPIVPYKSLLPSHVCVARSYVRVLRARVLLFSLYIRGKDKNNGTMGRALSLGVLSCPKVFKVYGTYGIQSQKR